jgi:hypothetical protein
MDPPLVQIEMPAWLTRQVTTLQTIAQIYTSTGRELSLSGDVSGAQDAYHEAVAIGTDIVAIEQEWIVPSH